MKLFKQQETEVILHWSLLIPFGFVITDPKNRSLMLLIFTLVLAHEFGHIFMARRFGLKCPKVLLCALGGLAHLEREPETPGAEFMTALAGPLVNVVLIALAFGLASVVPHYLLVPFVFVNCAILLLNIIPAFPLDGGRMLRAALQTIVGRDWATSIALTISLFISSAGVGYGLYVGNYQLVLVSAFILLAAIGNLVYPNEQENIPEEKLR